MNTLDFTELTHAYGEASDIPELLDALDGCQPLPQRWQDEPLSSLWQALCHQTSTFDASYAAMPRLVDIVHSRPASERAATLHLVGSIAAYQERGAPVPDLLQEAYGSACKTAAEVVQETLRATTPASLRDVLLLIADLTACRGHGAPARAMMNVESGEFDVLCRCGARGTLGVSDRGVEIAPLAWLRRPSVDESASGTAAYASLAESLGFESVARVLAELGGTVECPGCGRPLKLLDGLAAAYP